MATILVTGANGFVGSHILQALQQRSVRLIAACRDMRKLPDWFKGEVREGDLNDSNYIATLLKDVDTVCHAAAWTSLFGHAEASRELYLKPSLKLLNACVEKRTPRFINISTTSAAAPSNSSNAHSPGILRQFWPHLCNVISIENTMREHAGDTTMVNLRCGIFAGERYGLGLLPILIPRLKTHLVPWVASGSTSMPLIDGTDIGQAFSLAALNNDLKGFESFNIVGPEIPKVREVINFLHDEYGYPTPHFGVPFFTAYPFAWLMEKLDPFVPWDPLVTRSIVHLLEEVHVTNDQARQRLGYQPKVHWKIAIQKQIIEMGKKQRTNMRMFRPLSQHGQF